MRMSKKILLAKDLLPGDKIRLVYEIEVDEIGDLDAKFPSESDNLFFIKGTVIKGPLRKSVREFAISGDDKVTCTKRKSFLAKVSDRISSHWSATKPSKPKAQLLKKASGATIGWQY